VKFRRALRLAAAIAVVLSLGAVAAVAEGAPVTRLYVRNDSTTCPGFPFLSQTPGTEDANCGYIHGAPLGEVYKTEGSATNRKAYTTLPEEGTYALDAARDIAGQITIRNGRPDPNVPQRIGVGEVIVDLVLTGEAADGSTVALGSTQVKGTATPGANSMALPFTFDLDPALGQPALNGLTLETDVRGLHLYSGYTGANDTSWFDVPVIPAPEPTPAPTTAP
jgi:hypothetical protein